MKCFYKKTKLIGIILLVLFLLSGCLSTDTITSKYKSNATVFNTLSTLYIYDDFTTKKENTKFEKVWEECQKEIIKIDETLSTSIPTSDIYMFNKLTFGESIKVSNITAEVILIAKELYNLTDGYFDPSIFPLVDLWGFTPRFTNKSYEKTEAYDRDINEDGSIPLPEEKYINGLLKLVNFNSVILSGDEISGYTLTKNIPPVEIDGVTYNGKIDLGGIAKGYACDVVSSIMAENGYDYGYFSCGTSSISLKKSNSKNANNNNFNLAIKKPIKTNVAGDNYLTIDCKDVFLSSSGDYEKYYTIDNTNYCHIINSKTGYPINVGSLNNNISTVTLLGDNGAFLDGLSTAMCQMPFNVAKEFANNNSIIAFIVYTSNDKIYLWTNYNGNFNILDDNYILT